MKKNNKKNQTKTVNNDVNYPIWLHEVRFFDLINHIAIDYMHEGMLGIEIMVFN